MASLRAAMHLRMVDAYERLPDWRESVKTVTREHRELLRSIVEHDPDAAARHVQHHIRSFYNLNSEAEPATTRAP
jgi:DNA-binding FadR family transcriptional regulator